MDTSNRILAISGNNMSFNTQKIIRRFSIAGLTCSAMLFSQISFADNYIDSAQKYLANNEISSAVIELKNAIQSTPKDALPRIMLGKIYLQRGSYLEAEKELSKSIDLGGDKEKILPLLIRTKVNLNKNQDAIDLADNARISDPYVNTEILALKAIAEINLNQVKSAEQTLKLANQTTLDTLYTQIGQAKLDAAKNNIDAALTLTKTLLKNNANNSEVWLLDGHLKMAKRHFAEAATSYAKAYELAPEALQYSLFLSRALVYSGQFTKAEPYINKLLKLAPNQAMANELEAMILYSKDEYSAAKESADRAINNGSEQPATILIAAVSAYKLKLYEQANNRLKQIVPLLPPDHYARRLYIVTLLKLGYINQAVEEMEKLDIKSQANSSFLSQASVELSKLGRDEEALKLAEKAYSSDSSDSNAMMLGLVKLSNKDTSGFEDLKIAAAQQPDQHKADIGIGYYYLKLGAIDEASAIADKWLSKNKNDTDALVLSGMAYLAQNKLDKAEQLFTQALTHDPDNIQANISLARTYAIKQNWEETYTYAYKVKSQSPYNKAATSLLYLSGWRLNRSEDVLTLINQQLASAPNDIQLIQQKATVLVLLKQPNKAINLLENLPQKSKTAKTWSLIGDIYYTQKQWYDAERAYLKWLEMAPTNADAPIRSIHIEQLTNKLGSAINLADKAIAIFPNDVRFPIMKAELLLKSDKPDAAQDVMNTLDEKVRSTSYPLLIQGSIYIAKKQFNKAIPIIAQRYKVHPGLETAKELSSLYSAVGQQDKAIEFLSEVMDTYPKQARALQILQADIESQVNPQKAIKLYQTIIAREPNNVIALNNISWVLMDVNQPRQACQYSEKAYNLAKNQPAIMDTHGYCLLKSGHVEQATSLLQQAFHAAENNQEISLHYAESLIASGNKSTAKAVIDQVDIPKSDTKMLKLKDTLQSQLADM